MTNFSAVILANNCCSHMFYNCNNLEKIPELLATELVTNCYNSMFYNCKKLNYVNVNFTSWSSATSNWLYDVAQEGTFVKLSQLPSSEGASYIPSSWEIEIKYKPIKFISLEENSTIKLSAIGNPIVDGLVYRKNGEGEWIIYNINEEISLLQSEYIEFKNNKNDLSLSENDYVKFVLTGKFDLSGDMMSFINNSELCKEYCFYRLFYNCSSLYDASGLIFNS